MGGWGLVDDPLTSQWSPQGGSGLIFFFEMLLDLALECLQMLFQAQGWDGTDGLWSSQAATQVLF